MLCFQIVSALIALTRLSDAFVVPRTPFRTSRLASPSCAAFGASKNYKIKPLFVSDVNELAEEEAAETPWAVDEVDVKDELTTEEETEETLAEDEQEEEEEEEEEEEDETAEDVESVAVVTDEAAEVTVDGEEEPSEPKRVQRIRHTLFVGNLPFEKTDVEVRELFESYGNVEMVSIPRDKQTGSPRGFAFVDLSSEEELQAAIDGLDRTMFGGRQLRVNKSVPKDEVRKVDTREEQEGSKKLYVGNIAFETTQEDLIDYFGQFGEVFEVYVPVNRNTGVGRGFAFLTMKEEDVDKVIEETNGIEFQGRPIVVSLPLPRGEKGRQSRRDRGTKLYVGNLSFYTIADTLKDLFEEFGTVYDCYLPEDRSTGGSRGFAFVTMDSEAALQAIDELDGCEVDGRMIRVNEAQPKRQAFKDDWYEDDEEPEEEEGEEDSAF